MSANAAEALELALWLHRAPAHRKALAGRPLPEGIGHLLRIATGTPEALAAASAATGEAEPVVLEAVRFYLQQVLFREEANAYRVLGLRQDASTAQAREHHRLLQHWLHPDRRGNDAWESVFAGRVNSAWTQLRTPQARRAYDEALIAAGGHAEPVFGAANAVRAPGPRMAWRAEEIDVRADRGRKVAIGVLAGCLGLFAWIALRPEAPPEWSEHAGSEAAIAAEGEGDGNAAVSLLRESFAPAVQLAGPPPARPIDRPIAQPAAQPTAQVEPARSTVRPLTVASQFEAAPPPEPAVMPAPPAAAPVAAATAFPKPVETPEVTVPRVAVAVATTPPLPRTAAPVAPAPMAPPTAPPPQVADPVARMAQARDRAGQVVAYLGDRGAQQPPVWNDLRTAQEARGLRDALHQRLEPNGRVRLELREPQWRLSATGARLESRYRAARENGRLGIDFVWRENQLLVSAVSLVPAS